jgi:hypothetical protein
VESALAKAEKGRRLSDMRAGGACCFIFIRITLCRCTHFVAHSIHRTSAAESERLLRSCQEQLEAAKREAVMFKRTAHHAPPKQQHASQSHISQPLLNSYIGSAIRCV